MCFISIIFSACALTVYLKQVILNICDVIHYNKVYKVTTQKKIYFFVIWFPWGHPIVNLRHPFFPFYTCFLVIILHSWIMNVFGIYPYFTWIEMFPWWCYKNDTKMWFIWLHVLQGIVLLLCFGLFWIPLWVIITIYLWNKPSRTTKDWQNWEMTAFKRIKNVRKHCRIHEKCLRTYLEIPVILGTDHSNFSWVFWFVFF